MADWVTTNVAIGSGVGFDVSGAKKQKGGGSRRWASLWCIVLSNSLPTALYTHVYYIHGRLIQQSNDLHAIALPHYLDVK